MEEHFSEEGSSVKMPRKRGRIVATQTYSLEEIQAIWKIAPQAIRDMEACGLRVLQTTHKGAKTIYGADWIEFQQQIANSLGRTNLLNLQKWQELRQQRSTSGNQTRTKSQRNKAKRQDPKK